jgi:hypothetical protein
LVESNEKRFLNSGGFMGYASDIYEMIFSKEKIEDDEDDQLFYTNIFLNETTRVKFIKKFYFNFFFLYYLFRQNGLLYLINEQIFL